MHQSTQGLRLFYVTVFTLLLSGVSQAQEEKTPQWAEKLAKKVQLDFEERLKAVENDITLSIDAQGRVVSSGLSWTGEPIPYDRNTGYYSPAPFDSTLDIMSAGSLPEARSQYAAALQSGKWSGGISIIGVDVNGQNVEIAKVGDLDFPVLSYNSVEEVGMTDQDRLAELMLVEHLQELDPSGELLAQCRQVEREWFDTMNPNASDTQQFTVSNSKTMLCSTNGRTAGLWRRMQNTRNGNNQCQPCNLQRMPQAPEGTAYGYQPAANCGQSGGGGGFFRLFRRNRGNQQVSYKNGQQNLQVFKRLDLGPQRMFTQNLDNPYYSDCNQGILMGARGMIRGDWRPRVIRQDQNYLNMGLFKKLAAHVFPRVVGMNNCLDCQTIQGLAGRRLMITIALATSLGGGNGNGNVSTPNPPPMPHVAPMMPPVPMPMPPMGMPMMPGLLD